MESMLSFFEFLCDIIDGEEDDDDSYYVGLNGLNDVIEELGEAASFDQNILMREDKRYIFDQVSDRIKFLYDRVHDLQTKKITDNPQDVYNGLKIFFTEIAKFQHFVLDSQKHTSLNYADVSNFNY
ncbi:hypothetical protein BLA29_009204 [Euroglyphus maynei]|uniref:Uncharacterized protein n=1 Tax=Euroglyphus maynei TaxID=6958 RepID=A0A1Y3BP61_EURMA|nr:hypothetical protein BLA29_009204 [Euroglyphus maynei]